MSLNNLGIRLSEDGQHQLALKAAFEAVDINPRLAATNRGSFLPDLANSLWNIGYVAHRFGDISP